MARGRIIDREIYSHETLSELSIPCRYLHQGLIVWADDQGRMKAHPKYLKAKIFPYDNIKEKDIEGMVNQLATIGCLTVYQVGDSRFLEHKNWSRWQSIRKDRFKPSDCPSSVDGKPLVNQSATVGMLNLTQPNLTKPNVPQNQTTPSQRPSLEDVKEYCSIRSNSVDPEKWFNYYESNGWKVGKNPMKDWRAAVRTWEKSEYGSTTKEASWDRAILPTLKTS